MLLWAPLGLFLGAAGSVGGGGGQSVLREGTAYKLLFKLLETFFTDRHRVNRKKKVRAVFVIGHGGPYGCLMSRQDKLITSIL
jgi:hypothetical protein